jgi:competence protein ComEC
VPKKQAIDVIRGRKYIFIGDSILSTNDFNRNLHLQPSRILHRVQETDTLQGFHLRGDYISYRDLHIMKTDTTISFSGSGTTLIDLLVISRDPRISLQRLSRTLQIKQVVLDGSVPYWKIKSWKKDCDSLGIPCHDVNSNGAFVMNLR